MSWKRCARRPPASREPRRSPGRGHAERERKISRPIAMGDALRKLAMTLLCKMHREQFDGFFTAPLKPGRGG